MRCTIQPSGGPTSRQASPPRVTLPAIPSLLRGMALLAGSCLAVAPLAAPAWAQHAPPTRQHGAAAPGTTTGQGVTPPGAGNTIVAIVNGEVVSSADVLSRSRLFALNAGMAVSPEVVTRLAPQITRLLVDERLRMQDVQRRRIAVSDEDVANAVDQIEQRNNLPKGMLITQLRHAGIQPRVLFDQIRTQIGWSRLLRAMLGPSALPTDQEVKDYLSRQAADVGKPEYLLSEIFIPVDDPGSEGQVQSFTQDVIKQLRGGTPFPVVATQFSQSQSALQGGDRGWVQTDSVDPQVAALLDRMPVGAISNPIKVAGGFDIVQLRGKRQSGRQMATVLSIRQAHFSFSSPLDPNNPTEQQRQMVERARSLGNAARDCSALEAAQKQVDPNLPSDPGPVVLENVNPPPLRAMLANLPVGKASQPIISSDSVTVMMICSREQRNLAEVTPDQAREQILRNRVELLSRQLQRDLRRRGQIDMRVG